MGANEIDTVVDAGANTGQYALMLRASGYKGKLISFEPQESAYRQLALLASKDSKWITHQVALGEVDADMTMNISGQPMSSSLLAMRDTHVMEYPGSGYVGTERIKVSRLDTILGGLEPSSKLMLKLDVQGYELALLQGASQLLTTAKIVEAEVCLEDLYQGQPTAGELFTYLEEAGFELAMFTEGDVNRIGRAIYGDALFVRSER